MKEKGWKKGMKLGAVVILLLLLVGGTIVGNVSAKQTDGGNKGKGKKDPGNVTTQNVVAWVDTTFSVSPSSGSINTPFYFDGDATYYYLYAWPKTIPIGAFFEMDINYNGFNVPYVSGSSWGTGYLFFYRSDTPIGSAWHFYRSWLQPRTFGTSKYLDAIAYPRSTGNFNNALWTGIGPWDWDLIYRSVTVS